MSMIISAAGISARARKKIARAKRTFERVYIYLSIYISVIRMAIGSWRGRACKVMT